MTPDQTAYKKSSFGPAFLFLDKRRRSALAVYYAFCRLMDDIADEPEIQDKNKQLAFWQAEIKRVYDKNATAPLGRELEKLVTDFNLTQDRFVWLIEGMQADVQGRTYQTFEELEWYLWRVAGIVGLTTLDIIGIKGPKAQDLAKALGFAVQITNIIRDVYEDAQLGRVYLPQDLLAKHHLTAQDILQGVQPEQIAPVLQEFAQKANAFYQQAHQILCTLPKRKILPCRIMGFVYRQNLAKIEKTGFRFNKALKLSKPEKIKYSIYALFHAFFSH